MAKNIRFTATKNTYSLAKNISCTTNYALPKTRASLLQNMLSRYKRQLHNNQICSLVKKKH